MAQLNHILNLIKRLEKEEIDYFLITLRHEGSEKKADVFYKFENPESIRYVNETLDEMEEEDTKNGTVLIHSSRRKSPKKAPKKTPKKRASKKRKK